MPESLGRAVLELTTDSSKFFKDLDRVDASGKKLELSFRQIGNGLSGLFGTITGGVAAGKLLGDAFEGIAGLAEHAALALPRLVQSTISLGSELLTTSLRTGISVETLSALRYVAAQTGTDLGALTGTIFKLQANLGAVGDESAKVQGAVKTLGLNLRELKNESPDQAFLQILARLHELPTAADRAGVGMALFGKGWKEIAQLAEEDVNGLIAEAQRLGIVMTTDMAAAAKAAEDSLSLFKAQIEAASTRLGAAFLPAVIGVAHDLSDLFVGAVQAAGDGVGQLGGFLGTLSAAMGTGEDAIAAQTELYFMLRDALISLVRSGLEPLVTGLGKVASFFDSLDIIIESAVNGYQAIAYAIENVTLASLKMTRAMTVGGFGVFDEAIKNVEHDIDRLYNSMADGVNRIEASKKAQKDWGSFSQQTNASIEAGLAKVSAAHVDIGKVIKSVSDLSRTASQQSGQALTENSKAVATLLATLEGSGTKLATLIEAFRQLTTEQKSDATVQAALIPIIDKMVAAHQKVPPALLAYRDAAIAARSAEADRGAELLRSEGITLGVIASLARVGLSEEEIAAQLGVSVAALKEFDAQAKETVSLHDALAASAKKVADTLASVGPASLDKDLAKIAGDEQAAFAQLSQQFQSTAMSLSDFAQRAGALHAEFEAQRTKATTDEAAKRVAVSEAGLAKEVAAYQEGVRQEADSRLEGIAAEVAAITRRRDAALVDLKLELTTDSDFRRMREAQIREAADRELAIATGTTDDLVALARELGVKTQGALDAEVEKARAIYETLRDSGESSWLEVDAAAKRYVATLKAARTEQSLFGSVLENTLANVSQLIEQAFTGGGGLAGAGKAIGAEFGKNMGTSIGEHFERTDPAFMASKLGTLFGKALPGIGALIGPAVGKLISWIGSLFGTNYAKDIAHRAGSDFGQQWSDGLQKKIVESSRQFKDEVAGELFNLGDIIKEHPINTSNLALYERKVHDIFSMIQTGHFSVEQATKVLDDVFPDLAKAATNAYGFISDELKGLIKLNDEYGTHSKAVADFLKQQGDAALQAGNDIVAGVIDPYVKLHATLEPLRASLKQLVDDGKTGTDEWKKAFDELVKAQDDGIIHFGNAKRELDDVGTIALATFGAAIASGKSFVDALAAAGPALSQLGQAFADLGIPIENTALKSLVLQSTLLQNNPQLIKGVSGLGDAFAALSNMGLLNVDTFDAMERTGLDMYTRLQGAVAATGGDTRDALLPMQDYLHKAAEAAKELGVPLDENTQRMIDQSQELGIWKDIGESPTDKLNDGVAKMTQGIETLTGKLQEFIDTLTGKLPKNVTTTVDVETRYTSSGQPPPGGSGPTDENSFATGTSGLRDFGAGQWARLHGLEAVVTADEWQALHRGLANSVRPSPIASDALFSRVILPQADRNHLNELRNELSALRTDMRVRDELFPRMLARAVRDEVQKVGVRR